jgi:hypothetical protein
MSAYIHIPKPCTEDWNTMQPEEKGRHCLMCCKTVVDFTSWDISSISEYLKTNAEKKVCGHFYTNQLTIPIEGSPEYFIQQIYNCNLSLLRKIAAIIVITFGLLTSSCNDEVKGKVKVEEVTMGVILPEPIIIDSAINIVPVVGDTMPKKQSIRSNPVKKKIKCKIEKSPRDSIKRIFMGEVQVIEERR